MNFNLINESKPSYSYVINGVRKNRFAYRKDVLVSKGFDPLLSEHKICTQNGWFRIYDCGTLKYVYKSN